MISNSWLCLFCRASAFVAGVLSICVVNGEENPNPRIGYALPTPQQRGTLPSSKKSAASLIFAPDGRTLFAADQHGIKAWDIEKRQLLYTLELQLRGISMLSMSIDGRVLIGYISNQSVACWDVQKRTLRCQPVPMPEWIQDLALSPDGSQFAVALGKKGVVVHDSSSGRVSLNI
ncbi:MAG: hypothetical protein L0287_35100, partial [Anaerolineae bacterium]|nr:hypothetical protein [Anaerolineae bacterium]